MGYTVYFSPIMNKKENKLKVEKLYDRTIKIIHEFVLFAKVDQNLSLSGYTAHTKVGQYAGIKFNGKQGDAHEDFYLRELFHLNEDFNFCKTARKPYSVVVHGAVLLLKELMPNNWDISSDDEKFMNKDKFIVEKFKRHSKYFQPKLK